MKPVIAKAHELSTENQLSREVINFSQDKNGMYRGYVKTTSYKEDRSEVNYFYVNGEGLTESQVCRILLAAAAYTFLGSCADEITEKLIIEAKKSDKKSSKTKAKPVKEASEETDTKKSVTESAPKEDGGAEETEAKAVETKKPAKEKTKKATTKKPKTTPFQE